MAITNDNDAPSSERAKSVTRALVNSVAKLEAVHHVSTEDCLEGMLKATAVYAMSKLGSPATVAVVFEEFAEQLRAVADGEATLQ